MNRRSILLGATSALVAAFVTAPVSAGLLLTGVGVASAPNTYAPLATKIPPGAYLKGSQLGTADTSYGIISLDIKCITGTQATPNDEGFYNVYLRDVVSSVFTLFQSEGVPGFNLAVDNSGGAIGTLKVNFADNSGNPVAGTNKAIVQTISSFFLGKQGTSGNITIIYSLATSGARHIYTYWNGVLAQADGFQEYANGWNSAPAAISGTFVPYIMANTAGFGIGQCNASTSPGAAFDICRLVIDTSHTDDAAVSQAAATARAVKIWDPVANKPVDLGTGGQNLFGSQLNVYHVGNAANFPTELGSSAATWTVTASNVQPPGPALLWDAAVGPGGPVVTNPYDLWNTGEVVTPASTVAVTNRGCAIAQGDFLMVLGFGSNNTTAVDYGMTINQSFAVPSHTGLAIPVQNGDLNGRPNNLGVWTKVAAAGDVTAVGSDWANAPTISFATVPTRNCQWRVINFGQITGIDVMDAAIAAAGSGTHLITLSSPGSSTTTKGLLLSIVALYGMPDYTSAGAGAITLPTGQRAINATLAGTSSSPQINISAEPISATGAVGTRTCNSPSYSSAFAAGKPSTLSILLKP